MTPNEIQQLKDLLNKALEKSKYTMYKIDYKMALDNITVDNTIKSCE